jgi:hypothetical protein
MLDKKITAESTSVEVLNHPRGKVALGRTILEKRLLYKHSRTLCKLRRY